MAFGANKMKPKLNKLTRPENWPPPPDEEKIPIKRRTLEEDEPTNWIDYIFGKPRANRFSVTNGVPDKPSKVPMPNCLPPKNRREEPVERHWSYEIISEPAYNVTSKLNFYKERKRLRNIVSMTATDSTTTILLEVYDW